MALYWMLLGKIPHMRKWLIMATMYIILTSIALVFWKIFICMPLKRQYDISSGKYGSYILYATHSDSKTFVNRYL